MASGPKGLDKLLRQIGSLPQAVVEEAAAALGAGAEDMAGAIRRAAPDDKLKASVGHGIKPPPGALSSSRPPPGEVAGLKLAAGLSQYVWAGDNAAFWARWTEFGTARHEIKPKKLDGGVLAFELGGEMQFATKVQHPGEKAQPFFYPTIRSRKKLIKNRMIRAGSKAAKRAAGVS